MSVQLASPARWPRMTSAHGGGVRELLPGLLLASVVGLAAHLVAKVAFPYGLAIGLEVPVAMLLGLLVANLSRASARTMPGIRFSVKNVLGLGIVLLGLRLNLQAIALIGGEALGLVLLTIGGVCVFAIVAGRRFGVPPRVALLIGLGTSVCGASAIAAAAPLLKADDREVSFSIATITVFGSLAVVVYPLMGHALDLDVLTFGLWSGSAVPDTAQTIASGAVYSTVARDVATVVKLVRNVLIIPLLLLISWGWSRFGTDTEVSAETTKRSIYKAFPIFLIGFLALALVRTANLVDPERLADIDVVTRACFVVALAAFGLQTRIASIRAVGPRPFLLGFGTFALLGAGSLTLIVALGLGPARTAVAGSVDPRPLGSWTPVCQGEAQDCADVRDGMGAQKTDLRPVRLTGRVLATGIPGVGALSPVGTFHPGGPMHDKREFAESTRPGEILDGTRLLVASTSNFGAPTARDDWAEGSILSLATDPSPPLRLSSGFASTGTQARSSDGSVQLYTAQAPSFLNRVPNPQAATADMPAVSNPLGISVNNAFGRPWFANAPGSAAGIGVESVTDPDGRPLSEAPSERAGGVFAGTLTDSPPQRIRGSLHAGAVGNAFLGASPDTSGRAVFAVATADGALVQVHVEQGVDGLMPPGTFGPLPQQTIGAALGEVPTRVGMVFNWVPDRFLYVTDPVNDSILQMHLDDDFEVFRVVETRRLASPYLSDPVDLAPVVPEVANPGFSSNTTLAGGADLYVANRKSGTIVRLRQDGRIVAVARIELPGEGAVGAGMLNGIAVSPDAETIWVSLAGDRHRELSGTVIEVPAFGAP